MLLWYISECSISLININNGIKKPIHRYQSCNTTLIIPFSEGWLILCGKLTKVILSSLSYVISATRRSRVLGAQTMVDKHRMYGKSFIE